MKVELKQAIETLKELKRCGYGIMSDKDKEAIDTVVKEVEKTTYTADDMVDFAGWVKKEICKNKVGIRFNGEFVQFIEGIPIALSNEQIVKLWEEQK